MEKKIILADKQKCSGCAACSDICSKNAISMSYAEELHAYPIIDKLRCISCGRCMSVCPALNNEAQLSEKQHYYCAWSSDSEERQQSTSGGIGTAISRYAIDNGWYVCAAAFDNTWKLHHHCTNSLSHLSLFKGSKYLQSNTEGIFRTILELINNNEKVLFIGTPCQIEALNRFVPLARQGNLLTCGIICHGVNSPVVWKDYVQYIEAINHSKLLEYNFRSKSKGWQKKNGGPNLRVAYQFESGRKYDVPSWNNQFHYWFGKHYILRPSCIDCKYRKEQRNSDITIGDFWGIDKLLKNIDTYNGISVLIVSSTKGEDFIKSIPLINKQEIPSDQATKVLKGYIDRTPRNVKDAEIIQAQHFKQMYLHQGFSSMVQKYPCDTTLSYYFKALRSKLLKCY